MKILNGAVGYIEKQYGAYGNAVDSYLGDTRSHLYVNFALEDEVVRRILDEYVYATPQRKKELITLYNERVKTLIDSSQFYVKEGKKDKIPSIEVDEHATSGYLIGMSCSANKRFIENGTIVYVPAKYYSDVKVIQRVEIGYGSVKRVTGFIYIPYEIHDFKLYVVTRRKDASGKYYMEEATIDYDKKYCELKNMFLDENEYRNLRTDLKEL